MPRMVSPGVFTIENDQTFLQDGIAEIGAAFVGPFLKGPAFRPIVVHGADEFGRRFGGTTPDFYTPHAVTSYLREAGTATIVRVLGLGGYDSAVNKSIRLTLGSQSLALIHPSRIGLTLSGSISGSPTSFTLTLSGSSGLTTIPSLSIDPLSSNYYVKVLGNSPLTKYDGYVYAAFPQATLGTPGALVGSGSLSCSLATGDLNFSGSVFGVYSSAATPQIRSQLISNQRYNLFKVRTLSDGTYANTDVKISISGLRPATLPTEYGTFSLSVRVFTDTDNNPEILEQFDGLSLDVNSPNYIGLRIGTQHAVIDANGESYLDGDFVRNSKFIYIDIASGIEEIPTAALPYGFDPLNSPINRSDVPAPAYVTTIYRTLSGTTTPVSSTKVYYGIDLSNDTSIAYCNALPSGSVSKTGVGDGGFFLDTSIAAQDLIDTSVTTATYLRKFTVPFQGGFDGQNPAVVRNIGGAITSTNTMGYDLSDSGKDGARAYALALSTLANTDAFDINMLVTPGVIYSQHPYVTTTGINICESRGDCFYILDAALLGDTVDAAVNAISGLDTNYAATYHPWVKIREVSSNKTLWAPPSVVMPAVFAFNDRVGGEFFAPAGMYRGGLSEALQVRSRLDQRSRDVLYEGRVNPIATFPGQGIVAWGQKTLQHSATALDRINVRRLLIMVKKFIASSSRYLVFEQNTDSTRNKFLNLVNPYLAAIQERQGLYAFKVVMDDTNNTADLIDRNILVGQLYLKPARSVEFIQLEFNVLPTGAVFPS